MRIIEAGDQLLIFDRITAGERLRCTFNLSDLPARFSSTGTPLLTTGEIDGARLGAYAAIVQEIE